MQPLDRSQELRVRVGVALGEVNLVVLELKPVLKRQRVVGFGLTVFTPQVVAKVADVRPTAKPALILMVTSFHRVNHRALPFVEL